jgi:hypothetical protein
MLLNAIYKFYKDTPPIPYTDADASAIIGASHEQGVIIVPLNGITAMLHFEQLYIFLWLVLLDYKS